ncbi:hypothetical protein [Nocardia nepalensis]|uniref:hypothetical protein n=1 Tax=Nocardia nepalensis TaxID=3375448 RepID=UPI003B685712
MSRANLELPLPDGTEAGRTVQGWWESVHAPATLDAHGTLITHGYRRTSTWRTYVTASGAVRYFANATIGIEDAVTGDR